LSIRLFFVPILLSGLALWAADTITHLNVKEGLWETTSTKLMTGMGVPAESLAKMSPDQRARVEAMMKENGLGTPATDVHKECITKEKLEMRSAFGSNGGGQGDCKHTVVTSTGSKLEMKIHCEGKDHSSDGTVLMEAINSDSVKGKMQFASTSKGRNMNMEMSFTGRYLGADCGDVK
jgi:Protein of unknown function (DUF3617)